MSPVWRVPGKSLPKFTSRITKILMSNFFKMFHKGLDPHLHTPVEILHVVLLGFVKYFWRDAIDRLNPDKKKILSDRVDSLVLDGLGVSPMSGFTFVQHYGSLTGRDFRAIIQTAPFLLYDLLPPNIFQAWLSLCSFVPMVWQPEITHRDQYLVSFFF